MPINQRLLHSRQQLVLFWKKMGIDERLLDAFRSVPRERFVSPDVRHHAYDDHPLPTLRKQSVSQPSTIMLMLHALELHEGEKVFELGAGVGYQAALMAQVVGMQGKVVSAEIIPELVHAARRNMGEMESPQVQVLEADGGEGHPAEAPFDKIIITAACPTIPQPLIDQLREGGIIVAPVGDLQSQTMVKGTKVGGRLELEFLGDFVFVPMKGKHGFESIEAYYE